MIGHSQLCHAITQHDRTRLFGDPKAQDTSRTVFLGRDARHAIADYLESERAGDADEHSDALFLAASSIAARRPGGRLSPRSVNTIVSEIRRIHDAETTDRERQLGVLRPHDLTGNTHLHLGSLRVASRTPVATRWVSCGALRIAETAAPEEIRAQPKVRALACNLLTAPASPGLSGLREFATRLGAA